MKNRTKSGTKENKPRKRLNKTKGNLVNHVQDLEKTFPNFTLSSHEHLAYLIDTKHHGYSNIHKIEHDMLNKSLANLSSITTFLTYVDISYRSQYYSSPEFRSHINMILGFKPTKKQEDFENAITIYSSFVNLGINGLKRNLPSEFDKVIDGMITPIQNLLEGISQFSVRYGDKKYRRLAMFNSFGIQVSL